MVDNVLLVHQVDARVIILYDIFLDSRAPISAPLPLLLRGFRRSSSLGARSSFKDVESSEAASYPSDHEATMYGDDWTFLVPDLICDVSSELVWKIYLDLEVDLLEKSFSVSVYGIFLLGLVSSSFWCRPLLPVVQKCHQYLISCNDGS